MKKFNINRSSILLLIIVGVLAVSVIAVGLLVSNKRSDSSRLTTINNATKKSSQISMAKLVELIPAKLPEGWAVDRQEFNGIVIRNEASKCTVDVSTTKDTAESNSPTVDHKQRTLDAIKQKGYTVTMLPQTTASLATNKGGKQLDLSELDITGYDNPISQSYGFISTEQRYTTIKLSCPERSNLPQAKQALDAIKVNI